MPEIRPVRVVDACAGADEVDVPEGGDGAGDHGGELQPRGYVRFAEEGAGPIVFAGVLGEKGFGFGAQGEVGE